MLLFTLCLSKVEGKQAITLEHATTSETKTWGLMGRTFLPENQGMLFHYSPPLYPTLWSFNCYIDLSVAFLDDEKVILDICDLYAHPDRMDPRRPIRTLEDMKLYPYSDPVVQFFLAHSIKSNAPISYVLEMNRGWFDRNGVQIGDRLEWSGTDGVIKASHFSYKSL